MMVMKTINYIRLPLVIAQVSVDYAPDEQPTFFKDGYPVHSNLTVEFIEDRILTKNDIEHA